jgi:hypothetical protein
MRSIRRSRRAPDGVLTPVRPARVRAPSSPEPQG